MTIKRINHTDIGKESIGINRFGRHHHTPVRTTDNSQNRNNQHHHFKQSSHFTFSHSFIFHITGFPSFKIIMLYIFLILYLFGSIYIIFSYYFQVPFSFAYYVSWIWRETMIESFPFAHH